MVMVTFLVLVGMGKKSKIEASSTQPFPGSFCQFFIHWNQRLQDISVLFQCIVYVPDQVDIDCILSVVIGISAAIIAKFFVYPTSNGFATVEAQSFFLIHILKIQISLTD